MKPSKDMKTHAIITFTGTHYLITKEQEAGLVNLGGSDSIRIGDNTIKGSDIAQVMNITKYYFEYPDKKPSPSYKENKEYLDEVAETPPLTKEQLSIGRKKMIAGYERAKRSLHGEKWEEMKKSDSIYQFMLKKDNFTAMEVVDMLKG